MMSNVLPFNMSSSHASIRSAYDIASAEYSRKFINELDHKPFDRELLKRFAGLIGAGNPVLDIGCGPGHTTAYLNSLGLRATGIDLSPRMIEHAAESFQESRFEVGDFFSLSRESSSIAGILAFYCIVHLTQDQLVSAFTEMYRVLCEDGVLLLSFHVGSEVIHAENFLGTNAVFDFTFFQPFQIETALTEVGFAPVEVNIREPYETEHPSKRCYMMAHKPKRMA